MILTYHEGFCVRASAGDTTLVFGPVSKKSKNFKATNFGADVAFLPLAHADANGAAEASRGEREPFVVYGPGEYEVKDITASGYASRSGWDGEKLINTIYALSFDGLSVLYLGALGDTELPPEIVEMDAPDILILPVCGKGALSPADAAKLAVKLEAKMVIPLAAGDDKALKQFLKEAGEEAVAPVDKLTLKPRDVSGKENEVVVLSA